MRMFIFSAQDFEREFFDPAAMAAGLELNWCSLPLDSRTAPLAHGFAVVSLFANDVADATALRTLHDGGTRFIALRCAGFNQIDLAAARALGLAVARVPEYSPYAVAEHATALLLMLNRHLHHAYARVREQNFSLQGLLGFDLHGKTVGVIGLGRIGLAFARIMRGFGCTVLACDPVENPEAVTLGVRYVALDELLQTSRIISLHCPLTDETRHLINRETLAQTQPGVFLINTGRGALVDSKALIAAIKSGHLGGVGLDVYEQEAGVFFQDHSGEIIEDDSLARLMSFPNVVITGHQGFFTREALSHIAEVTLTNVRDYQHGRRSANWLD